MLVPQEGIFRTSQMEINPSNLQRQKISKSTWDLEPTEKSLFSASVKPSYPPSDHGTQDTEPQHATWTSCFSLTQRGCILWCCELVFVVVGCIFPNKAWVSLVLIKGILLCEYGIIHIIEVSQQKKKQPLMSLLPTQKNPWHERSPRILPWHPPPSLGFWQGLESSSRGV